MIIDAVRALYGRVPPFVRALPLAVAIPVAAEFLQHVVEIRLGMYRSGRLAPDAERIRLLFGAVKILAIFVTLLAALRWWAFAGDAKRAFRPSLAMFKGLAIVILIEIGGELALLLIGRLLGQAFGTATSRTVRIALLVGPLLLWLFFANLLLAWFVGLLTDDRTMTLGRSVRGTRGRLWATFGILLAGYLPLMIVHYAIGFGSMGRPAPFVWALMALDALVVGLLAVTLASTYFTIYCRAAEREPA